MTIYIIQYKDVDYDSPYHNREYYGDELQAKIRCYHLNKDEKAEWEVYFGKTSEVCDELARTDGSLRSPVGKAIRDYE